MVVIYLRQEKVILTPSTILIPRVPKTDELLKILLANLREPKSNVLPSVFVSCADAKCVTPFEITKMKKYKTIKL